MPQHLRPDYSDRPILAVIAGPQDEGFSDGSQDAFYGGEYRVTSTADRMGYRQQGPKVSLCESGIISDGIPLGAVQVPASQQPIVMMADRQTTGGYAKIAVVASADIPLLAQCLPGRSNVRFEWTSVEDAQRRYRQLLGGLERWASTF
jgi:allophanate hydrolase subunit 2